MLHSNLAHVIWEKKLRSFTLSPPVGSGASSIGVVLYQKSFFVSKASDDKLVELTGKHVYPTGGATIPWDGNPENAWSWHVLKGFKLQQQPSTIKKLDDITHNMVLATLSTVLVMYDLARLKVAKQVAMWQWSTISSLRLELSWMQLWTLEILIGFCSKWCLTYGLHVN